jgi:hypothetical protein
VQFVLLFLLRAAVSHFVAFEVDEMMVDDPGAIAVNYRCADDINMTPAIALCITEGSCTHVARPVDAAFSRCKQVWSWDTKNLLTARVCLAVEAEG